MPQSNRTAIVTGGGGAFGTAISRRLAADGFHVVITDADTTRAEATSASIPGSSFRVLDVTDHASVNAALASIIDDTGRIDVVVNNAGISPAGDMASTELADFDRTIAINLRGAYLVTSSAMSQLLAASSARVIMIGSRTWLSGGNPAYTASKAGLVGLCRTVAQDLGPSGGTCNVVAPGPVDTPFVDAMGMGRGRQENFDRYAAMTPLGRVAHPEDVAAATSFFASPDSSFITGEVLHVAGGLQLAPRL